VEFLGLRGVWVPRVERSLRGGIRRFEKNKCIFYIAPVGNLEKLRECLLTEKLSPDAECGGTGRWPQRPVCLTLLGLSTGRTLRASGGLRPV